MLEVVLGSTSARTTSSPPSSPAPPLAPSSAEPPSGLRLAATSRDTPLEAVVAAEDTAAAKAGAASGAASPSPSPSSPSHAPPLLASSLPIDPAAWSTFRKVPLYWLTPWIAALSALTDKAGGASSADSAGEWTNIALTFEIFGAGTPRRQVRAAEQLMIPYTNPTVV